MNGLCVLCPPPALSAHNEISKRQCIVRMLFVDMPREQRAIENHCEESRIEWWWESNEESNGRWVVSAGLDKVSRTFEV